MRNTVYVACMFLLTACAKDKPDPTEETAFIFKARTCEYVVLQNFYRMDVGAETGNSDFDNTYFIQPIQGLSVKADDYLIWVSVNSFNREMAAQPGFSENDYLAKADPSMEQQIDRYLSQEGATSSSALPGLNLVDIEYRKDTIIGMKVSATNELFGRVAFSSLNDQVEIFGTPDYHHFLFDAEKELIGSVKRGWSIDHYLNLRPLAAAYIYLRLTSVPKEAPLGTRFIVEMEMADGTLLRDTTQHITLVP